MPDLDEVLVSAARLRICAYLSGCAEAEFKAVADYCGMSAPTLSKQLTALAAPGYVDIRKVASGRYTRTVLALTDTGSAALRDHVAALQSIASRASDEALRSR
ncbi:transcriptional regulator [Kineococcus sp. NBC_00420]|uniref:transcriptional regulator n=1 Tax=Kineococcus sp. NBC_00420 TaxID=2903564 RepID=UPI002E240F7B